LKKNKNNNFRSTIKNIVIFLFKKNSNFYLFAKTINGFIIKYIFILKSEFKNKSFFFHLKLIKNIYLSEKIFNLTYNSIRKNNYSNNINYNFSYEDWFSDHESIWYNLFKKQNLFKKKINYLEIGSFEGRSTIFVLNNLKNAKINIVDTFSGSDEHHEINFVKVYKNFLKNTRIFKKRVTINKMPSNDFFKRNFKKFDLIYIDGSHYVKDVMSDCINSFKSLNRNGIIIIDDFMWNYYDNINENPIGAILPFIKKNYSKLNIIHLNYQIIIQKI
jgi:hypothetical protein